MPAASTKKCARQCANKLKSSTGSTQILVPEIVPPIHLVFEGPVLGPAKDWTGPGPERTGKLKDRKRPDRVKTAKDRCELNRLRPVETGLW